MSEPAPPSQPGAADVPTCYRHPGREAYIRCQRCERIICPDCMRDAAVGFQCPECLAKGSKDTRSGRTAYGGLRPTQRLDHLDRADRAESRGLAGHHAHRRPLEPPGGPAVTDPGRALQLRRQQGGFYPGVHSEAVCLTQTRGDGVWFPGVSDGAYWQLVTSTFTHVEIWHIGFNMLALWVLGPQLELVIGRARFLALYLLSGLAGSALVYWAAPQYTATLGASGAVFGLMGALLVVAYKVRGQVQQILIWIGINAVLTLTFGFSWQGHLGGFLGGVVIAVILVYAPRTHRTMWQVVGLSLFGLLLLVAIFARSVALTT